MMLQCVVSVKLLDNVRVAVSCHTCECVLMSHI